MEFNKVWAEIAGGGKRFIPEGEEHQKKLEREQSYSTIKTSGKRSEQVD